VFEISPGHHLKGVGCRRCYDDSQMTTGALFIQRARELFGYRFDYHSVGDSPVAGVKVCIRCREHDLQHWQDPKSHMRGHVGCPKCISQMLAGSQGERGRPKTAEQLTKDFTVHAREVHGLRYDYSAFQYSTANEPGKITCSVHGEFWQWPSNHLRGAHCPGCARTARRSNSVKQQCLEMGINYWRTIKRREAGLPAHTIFDPGYVRHRRKGVDVTVHVVEYPNLEEAVRVLQPPATTVAIARWLRLGIAPEEAFTRVPNPGYAHGIIYVVIHVASGRMYVGQTIMTLALRWEKHIGDARTGGVRSEASLHAAIRLYGAKAFKVIEMDRGTANMDLSEKEQEWIRVLETLKPCGFNILASGASGGSNPRPRKVDEIDFPSTLKAAEYLVESRSISLHAAKRRLASNRVYVKTPARAGESKVHTQAYKAWSRVSRGLLNPDSKSNNPDLSGASRWMAFDAFLGDLGQPPGPRMAFARLDMNRGFEPGNAQWLSKSEASRINAAHMKQNGRWLDGVGRARHNAESDTAFGHHRMVPPTGACSMSKASRAFRHST